MLHDVERRRDIGAEQHPPGGVERDRCLQRHVDAGLLPHANGGVDRGFQLQDVLHRFDDQHIRAAVDQSLDLVDEEIDDLLEAMLPEHRILGSRQQPGGADRSGHETRLARRAVLVGDAAGKLGGFAVQLVGQLADPVLLHLQLVAAEGVGFQHIGPGFEIRRVDLLDHRWLADDEIVVTPLFAAIVFDGELHIEDRRPHRTVINDRPAADEFEKAAHGGRNSLLTRD